MPKTPINFSSPSPRGSLQSLSQPCKTKFNRASINKQVFLDKELALHQDIIDNPFNFVNNLYRCPKALFNYFIMLGFRCRHIYATQEHIAKKTGMSIRQAQRVTNKFVELGILIVRYRHNTSNEYRFNSFFYNLEVLGVIRSISTGAKFISISLLNPFGRSEVNEIIKTVKSEKCRTKTINEFIYKSLSSFRYKLERVRTHTRDRRPDTDIELLESNLHRRNNESMMQNPFSKALTRVGMLLNLTKAGKVDMARYPDEALIYAESIFYRAKNVESKLKWFHSVCVRYCNDKSIPIDWRHSKKLQDVFEISDDDTKVELPSNSIQGEQGDGVEYSYDETEENISPDRSSSSSRISQEGFLKKVTKRDEKTSYSPKSSGYNTQRPSSQQVKTSDNSRHREKYNPDTGRWERDQSNERSSSLNDSYVLNRMCNKDDDGAILNRATKTYYREEVVYKKDPNRSFEKPTYDNLKAAFDRDTREQTPYFKSLRDLILSRAVRGDDLDVSVFADEPTKAMAREVHDERVKTSEEIEERLTSIIDIIKENYKLKRSNQARS